MKVDLSGLQREGTRRLKLFSTLESMRLDDLPEKNLWISIFMNHLRIYCYENEWFCQNPTKVRKNEQY
jgi:hypothetical protein